MRVELICVSVYIGADVMYNNLHKNETCMQEKSFVTQAGDSHFEQNSNKSAAKSWQLLAIMGHSMANQLWLDTISILYQPYTHACECDY